MLLIGAGLMLRSFLNQLNLDPGFRQDHVLTASLSLPQAKYKTEVEISRFYERLMNNLGSIPGVQSAGLGSDLPWTGYDENMGGFTIEGKKPPPHEEFHARYHVASQDYFRALGTPLVRGRFFTDGDNRNATKALIINQSMAKLYWPNEDVIGKRVSFQDAPKEKTGSPLSGLLAT